MDFFLTDQGPKVITVVYFLCMVWGHFLGLRQYIKGLMKYIFSPADTRIDTFSKISIRNTQFPPILFLILLFKCLFVVSTCITIFISRYNTYRQREISWNRRRTFAIRAQCRWKRAVIFSLNSRRQHLFLRIRVFCYISNALHL